MALYSLLVFMCIYVYYIAYTQMHISTYSIIKTAENKQEFMNARQNFNQVKRQMKRNYKTQ